MHVIFARSYLYTLMKEWSVYVKDQSSSYQYLIKHSMSCMSLCEKEIFYSLLARKYERDIENERILKAVKWNKLVLAFVLNIIIKACIKGAQ
jgi:hypothetical protein